MAGESGPLPFAPIALAALAAAACGPEPGLCAQMLKPAVTVTVVDGRSGDRLCDAEVNVSEGTFAASLELFSAFMVPCTYSGAWERAGTYAVNVALGARTASVSDVMVEREVCGVRTQSLTIELP
jgi:hypothetical protein